MKKIPALLFVCIMVSGLCMEIHASAQGCGGDGTQEIHLCEDWNITSNISRYDETIILSGNLTIAPNGTLTLWNTILKLDCTIDGEYGIEVKSGGTFHAYNSRIETTTEDWNKGRFWFYVRENTDFKLESSYIRKCGVPYMGGDYTGLTVKTENASVRNCTFTENNKGIVFSDTKNASVSNCVFQSNKHWGVHIYNCSNINIEDCTVLLTAGTGIRVEHSNESSIKRTRVSSGGELGISVLYSDKNTILNSVVSENNDAGISFINSNYNLVKKCTISEHSGYAGIYAENSNTNEFCDNDFDDNMYNAWDSGINNWHENYWSDYSGLDSNADGIGDVPYSIPGGTNQDNYPLMHPFDAICNVDKGLYYRTIQQAIDDADMGNTIEVASGIYYGCIAINKTLTLIGEDRNTTIIDGGGGGDVIYISEDWVNVSGVGVKNGYHGISQGWYSNNTIANCNVYNNSIGIYFHHSLDSRITNCIIYNNSYDGICLAGPPANCTVTYCDIVENGIYGIYIHYCNSTESELSNYIYHNNFINNTYQANDSCSNSWDNGYPSGGNYWSDYTGSDLYSGMGQNISGSDGIGDTPYNISGGSNQDRYPLMGPWSAGPVHNLDKDTYYNTIQDGVDDADSGNTLYISAQSYFEDVTVNKDITFLGEATLSGNLTVLSNGILYLDLFTLIMNCTYNGECQIEVYGEMSGLDSNITSANPDWHYLLSVRKNATFKMQNSSLSYSGWNLYNSGLIIEANNSCIENSVFSNNYCGIVFNSSGNALVSNCTFSNNLLYGIRGQLSHNCNFKNCSVLQSYGGISLYQSANTLISECRIGSNSYQGIILDYSESSIIENCVVHNNSYGIYLWDSSNNNQITNCNVYNNSGDGIYLYSSSNNNTITNCSAYNNYYGIRLSSSNNNRITNCTVTENYYGLHFTKSHNITIKYTDVSARLRGMYFYDCAGIILTHSSISGASESIYSFKSNLEIENITGKDILVRHTCANITSASFTGFTYLDEYNCINVSWHLKIRAVIGAAPAKSASVIIYDAQDRKILDAETDENGEMECKIMEYTGIGPAQKINYTPHKIVVVKNEFAKTCSVIMCRNTEVVMELEEMREEAKFISTEMFGLFAVVFGVIIMTLVLEYMSRRRYRRKRKL